MTDVNYNDKEVFHLAEDWNELSESQLISIAPFLLKKEVDTSEKAFIAYTLCGFGKAPLSAKAQRETNGYEYFSNELTDKVFPLIQFLFDENNLTKQLIPELNVGAKYQFFGTTMLYGAAENFTTLTIAEFSDTESCLKLYEETQEDVWFNRFIGILYRPKKKNSHAHHHDFDGDVRQEYNFHLNDFIAAMVQKTNPQVKAAILLWYYGCRNQLVQDYKFLFSKTNTEAAEDGSWTDVIHELAGPKFGTVENTMRANLKVILKELKLMHDKAQELKLSML